MSSSESLIVAAITVVVVGGMLPFTLFGPVVAWVILTRRGGGSHGGFA